MLPLEGITVVSLEQALSVPFATRQLADLGARVIKIERPGVGDFARHYDHAVLGMSAYFVWSNRSKESLTLDLKHPEAHAILTKLVCAADVFVQNLAPGAVDRLGLGTSVLQDLNPRLIICDVSGYGSTGPYREKKAYDLLVQCESGVLSVTGTPDTPSRVGMSIADIASAMYAYSGILTALYQRERTGTGSVLEVSMLEALGEWMMQPALFAGYSGKPPPRSGARHATIAPYGPFQAGDGKTVFLGIQNEREWARFCEVVLARPELASDSRFSSNTERVANREELQQIVEGAFGDKTVEQVIEQLERTGIANAHLNSADEFWNHPQLEARDRWREISSPAGPVRAMIPPVTVQGTEPYMGAVPELGEQTESILAWLGYTREQIARLRAEGAI